MNLLLILILLLLLFGGTGYGVHSGWFEGVQAPFYGGGLIGILVVILLVLFLFGRL